VDVGGGGTDYLFDLYGGASLGLSLRRISSSFNGDLVTVVRVDDLEEMSFGLVNDVVDVEGIESFLGSSLGRVSFWADQSGNGNFAHQNVLSLMPIISLDGTVIIDAGSPAILFQGFWMNLNTTIPEIDNTKIGVARRSTGGISGIDVHFFGTGVPSGVNTSTLGVFGTFGFTFYGTSDKLLLNSSVPLDFNPFILWGSEGNSTLEFRKDGNSIYVAPTFVSMINTINKIGVYNAGNEWLSLGGFFKEVIHYPSNQILNVTGIETNINTYYAIY
jgi:hypothetical protein